MDDINGFLFLTGGGAMIILMYGIVRSVFDRNKKIRK